MEPDRLNGEIKSLASYITICTACGSKELSDVLVRLLKYTLVAAEKQLSAGEAATVTHARAVEAAARALASELKTRSMDTVNLAMAYLQKMVSRTCCSHAPKQH